MSARLNIDDRGIVEFYLGNGTDFAGRTLQHICDFSDAAKEKTHNYIQVLFPLPESSRNNMKAHLIDEQVLEAFRENSAQGKKLRGELRRAFEAILAFWGFQPPRRIDGLLKIERAQDYEMRSKSWAGRGVGFNHNHQRITRVIRCLRLLGLEGQAQAFMAALTLVMEESSISKSSFGFWRRAAERPLHIPATIEDADVEHYDGLPFLKRLSESDQDGRKQKEKEKEKARQEEREKLKEKQREQEKERERQKKKQKEREREKQKEKEREKESARQKQKEKEQEMEEEKQRKRRREEEEEEEKNRQNTKRQKFRDELEAERQIRQAQLDEHNRRLEYMTQNQRRLSKAALDKALAQQAELEAKVKEAEELIAEAKRKAEETTAAAIEAAQKAKEAAKAKAEKIRLEAEKAAEELRKKAEDKANKRAQAIIDEARNAAAAVPIPPKPEGKIRCSYKKPTGGICKNRFILGDTEETMCHRHR